MTNINLKFNINKSQFVVKGTRESLRFSVEGKEVGRGKITNDGKISCMKGVEQVYFSRLKPNQEIKLAIVNMVRALSLALLEERQLREGKPVNIQIDKIWVTQEGEFRLSSLVMGERHSDSMGIKDLTNLLYTLVPPDLIKFNRNKLRDIDDNLELDLEEKELEELEELDERGDPENLKFKAPTEVLNLIKKL